MQRLSRNCNGIVTRPWPRREAARRPICSVEEKSRSPQRGPSVPTHSPFPPAPTPDAMEWPGTPIGAGNVSTRTKTRTAVHDKSIDRIEGRRDALVDAAVGHITRRAGKEPLFRDDVVIHGVRVRATTNSEHLHDFWVDNWYSPEEWKAVTRLTPSREPQVTVFALGGVAEQPEAAYYSRKTNTIVFFNTAYYGQLKSWVLGAVGRVLAEEYGIHSVHGACVEKDGHGILYIAPTGTGKSTSSYGLVGFPNTRFHSDDWVYIRYAFRAKDGRRLHPMSVALPDGMQVRGYRVFRWLESRAQTQPGTTVTGLDLENREITVPVGALDLDAPIEASAFTSEKIFYLRTNLVENFPLSAMQMLHSKMENVPDVSAEYVTRRAPMLDELIEKIRTVAGTMSRRRSSRRLRMRPGARAPPSPAQGMGRHRGMSSTGSSSAGPTPLRHCAKSSNCFE